MLPPLAGARRTPSQPCPRPPQCSRRLRLQRRHRSWTRRRSGRRPSCRRLLTTPGLEEAAGERPCWRRGTRRCSTRSRWPASRPWTTCCRTTWVRAGCSAASTAASCSSNAACTSFTRRCTALPVRGSAASVTRSAPTRTSSPCTSSTSSTIHESSVLRYQLRSLPSTFDEKDLVNSGPLATSYTRSILYLRGFCYLKIQGKRYVFPVILNAFENDKMMCFRINLNSV